MSWYLAGHVAGLGIRKAVSSAAQAASVRRAMDPATALAVRPVLDVDRVTSDRYYFQMGVPWGWRNPTSEEVADWGAMLGLPVVVGVVAERADANRAEMFVSPFSMDGESIAGLILQAEELQRARFSKVPSGHPLGSPAKILIAGEVGVFFHFGQDAPGATRGYPSMPAVPVSTTECFVARGGQGFRIEFSAGAHHHERYLPCLWTMLGSWRWLR